MKNKNILITGSSRGIGLATAKLFGLLGANIAINCSRDEEELENARRRLSEQGINVCTAFGDVSDYNRCKAVIDTVNSAIGELDILINNAGVSQIGLFTEQTPDEIMRITTINQFSVVNCCHLVLPSMIRRKKGKIINISSVWGITGASCEVAYSAAKGFVNTFTKALAKEVAPSNIIVNAIACGVIDTLMNQGLTPDELEELRNNIGLMRFGTTEDVARLCLYLAETEYMTGQVLALDGGMI